MNAQTPIVAEADEAKARRLALYEQREADREARARAPVGWLENYNDGADAAMRSLIAPLLSDDELQALSKSQRKFRRDGI